MLQRRRRSTHDAKMKTAPVGSHDTQSQIAGAVKDSAALVKDGFKFTRAGFKKEKMADEPQGLEGGGLLGLAGDADTEAEAFARPPVDLRHSNWAPNERDQFEAYLSRRQAGAEGRRIELQPELQPEPEPEMKTPRSGADDVIAADETPQHWSPSDISASDKSAVVSDSGGRFAGPSNQGVDPFDELVKGRSQDADLALSGRPNAGMAAAVGHSSGASNDCAVDREAVGNLIDL